MKIRPVRAAAVALLALSAIALPASTGASGEDRGGSMRGGEASLLIPAKTRLIISYSRRALA